MSDMQAENGQTNRGFEEAGVEPDNLHAAITAILKDYPDGLTPAEIIDVLRHRHLAGKADEHHDSFALRVVSTIVKGGFRVRDGNYFLPSAC